VQVFLAKAKDNIIRYVEKKAYENVFYRVRRALEILPLV
jgi:hypothetical protein